MSDQNKAEIREEMRAIFESVMILNTTSAMAHQMAMNDHSKKAEVLVILEDCMSEVKALRAQYDSLKRIHDSLE